MVTSQRTYSTQGLRTLPIQRDRMRHDGWSEGRSRQFASSVVLRCNVRLAPTILGANRITQYSGPTLRTPATLRTPTTLRRFQKLFDIYGVNVRLSQSAEQRALRLSDYPARGLLSL